MVNIEIKETHFCRSDLRIATKLTDSRESEFPPTMNYVVNAKNFRVFRVNRNFSDFCILLQILIRTGFTAYI